MCWLFYVSPLLLYYWYDTFVLLCIKIPILAFYCCILAIGPSHRVHYIIGIIWFSISVIINCGTGCLNVLIDFKTEKKVKSCTMGCGIGIISLSIQLFIYIIMLIANRFLAYSTIFDYLHIILLGVTGLFVLLLLIIHIIVFTTLCLCRRKVDRANSRLYRKRERQQVEIRNVPQTEPVPPYATIEMLPVNESQTEPEPIYDPIQTEPEYLSTTNKTQTTDRHVYSVLNK